MSLDKVKLKALIHYLVEKRLGMTWNELNALLFLCDFGHYREHLKPITGAEYLAMPSGPEVKGLSGILEEMEDEGSLIWVERTVRYIDIPEEE